MRALPIANCCCQLELGVQLIRIVVLYREAVSAHSPGLLQPWVNTSFLNNPERVAICFDATA